MSAPPARPFWISLLSLCYLMAAAAGFLRLAQTVYDWSLLSELALRPGPIYLAASGAVWGILALPAGAALLAGWHWAPVLARVVGAFLLTAFWLDRLLVRLVGSPPANTLFAFGASLVFLGLVAFAPAAPAARRFFIRRSTHEH